MISFGIGCFHFGVNSRCPDEFTGKEYIEELRASLEAIRSIGNVEVGFEGNPALAKSFEERTYSKLAEGDDVALNDLWGFVPHFHSHYGFVRFEMHIPHRVQLDLMNDALRSRHVQVQDFRIHCIPEYWAPVSYVRPLGDMKNPSDAVVIVRKLLLAEYEQSDRWVEFQFVGPSPFHADFHIIASKDVAGDDLSFQEDHRHGYNTIRITCASSADEEKVFNRAIARISPEAAVFYCLRQEAGCKGRLWRETSEMVDDLRTRYGDRSWRSRLTSYFTMSSLIDKAAIGLAHYGSSAVELDAATADMVRKTYSPISRPVLRSHVDREIENKFVAPMSQANELVSIFDRRQNRRVDAILLLLSAILGGAIASILTVALT